MKLARAWSAIRRWLARDPTYHRWYESMHDPRRIFMMFRPASHSTALVIARGEADFYWVIDIGAARLIDGVADSRKLAQHCVHQAVDMMGWVDAKELSLKVRKLS